MKVYVLRRNDSVISVHRNEERARKKMCEHREGHKFSGMWPSGEQYWKDTESGCTKVIKRKIGPKKVDFVSETYDHYAILEIELS